jgi:hypothetical protein
MTREERLLRFEELDAGRALGDLDAAEIAEWKALAAELGTGGDPCLDLLAAELEVALTGKLTPLLPAEVAARLRQRIPAAARKSRILPGPWLGWAIAACLLAFVVLRGALPVRPPSAGDRRAELVQQAGDLQRLEFTPAGDAYATARGEVVWSDARQEGYMTLSRLPANDPARKQYQLWIVDPARDEIPVDGGVFDIPAGDGPVVIPIDAKLAVKAPAAFVITLEQPGGVVRSKQETVVALAKR